MHKNAMKCNETLSKWYKNKHGVSKIIDTFETYQASAVLAFFAAAPVAAPTTVELLLPMRVALNWDLTGTGGNMRRKSGAQGGR
jgi:hypothetical protein